MPSTTLAQHKAMEAAAHGHSNLGIPQSVGQDFEQADKGRSYKSYKQKALVSALRKKKTDPSTMGDGMMGSGAVGGP